MKKQQNNKITCNKQAKCSRLLVLFFTVMAICFITSISVNAQVKTKVNGTVVDEKGEAIIGATVQLIGIGTGTLTDVGGKFSLNCPLHSTIKVSFIGFKPAIIRLEKETDLKVTLIEDNKILGEIVVTALGITRDVRSLGYARQSVDAESMTETRDPNLLNMLAGKAAGVQIISGGGPLSSTRVVIRGNNSITGNNQPLYVVDGVPILNNMGEESDLDYGNAASNINPDDIASMEVLKGANASALYGSDAANGVILITTKSASRKKGIGVSYNSNILVSTLSQQPTYQNIYGAGQNGRFQRGYNYYGVSANGVNYDSSLPYGIFSLNLAGQDNRSWGMPMLGFDIVGRDGKVKKYSPQPETTDNMYQTGTTLTNSFSIDKLINDVSVRFSYTNIHADDILKNFNLMDRNIFSLRSTAKISPFLDVDFSSRYTREDVANRGFRNASSRNPLYVIANMPRDVSLSELNPWKKSDGTALSRSGFINPYWLLNELSNADSKDWFMGNLALDLKFNKYFKLRLKGATDVQASTGYTFNNYYTPFDLDGQYDTFKSSSVNNNFDGLFSYNQTFDKFSIGANIGASSQDITYKRLYSKVDALLQPDVKSLANNASMLTSNESYNGKQKQGVYGFVNVGFNSYAYLDLTLRNDWSSTLPKVNNSYLYYSAGGSLILTDMFKINSDAFTYAKIRASYAKVGNDTGFDMLYNGYNYSGLYLSTMPYFQSETTRKNSDLKPETTTSWEVGSDLRFYKGRLLIDATYYRKSTKDQIVNASMPETSGYTSKVFNAGEIQNWGTELSVTVIPIKTKTFEWLTSLNWSKNNSMVKSLTSGVNRFPLANAQFTTVYAEVGKSYGVMYGNDYKRDDQGHILVTLDGVPLYETDKYLGSIQPDWMGGWRNTLKIGDFDFGCLIDFKKGGIFWSYTAWQGSANAQTVQSLEGREEYLLSDLILGETSNERRGFLDIGNTVTPGADYSTHAVLYTDGRSKGVYLPNSVYDSSVPYWAGQTNMSWTSPMTQWTHNNQSSMRRYIYDASYIKLREISFGYNLPKKIIQKMPFNSVRLSAVGRNVAILYQNTPKGLDPEATSTVGNGQGFERGYALPSANYGFDFKITF
jgi:TonB-linked SusC/RagA family outer membrane protein